ncbi:hypothetical protein SESBI_07907 [Sesbania bispinosa]|nr:hypothetical protein SESBI_07907 [Sesbania bispinosa]
MDGEKSKTPLRSETGTLIGTNLIEGVVLPITCHKLKWPEFYPMAKWQLDNSLVTSWLLNTMTTEIGEDFIYYNIAKEMWAGVKKTHSNVDNTSTIFEIKSILHDLRQGESIVTEYFNNLNQHWQELNIYEETEWKCPEDKKQYKELVKKDKIYKFVLGLDKDLNKVHGRILETKPFPKIREVFSEIRREESRRKLMLGNTLSDSTIESSALAARGNQYRPQQKKNRPWCDH